MTTVHRSREESLTMKLPYRTRLLVRRSGFMLVENLLCDFGHVNRGPGREARIGFVAGIAMPTDYR